MLATQSHYSKNHFFNQLEQQCQLQLEQLFNASDLKCHDIQFYKQLNQELKGLKSLDEIHDFIVRLNAQHIQANTYILNQLMQKLFYLKQISLALKIFRYIQKNKLENTVTYNTIFAKLSEIPAYKTFILDLFEEAKHKQMLDTVSYNSILYFCAKNKPVDVQQIADLYEEAKCLGPISLITVANAIYALSKQSIVDERLALRIFHEAQCTLGSLDSVIFSNMLLCLAHSKQPNPEDIMRIFNQSVSTQNLNAFIITNTLLALAKCLHPDIKLGLDILDTAKASKMLDPRIYGNLFKILAQTSHPQPELALDILLDAINEQQIDSYVFSQALNVFILSRDLDLNIAHKIYHLALTHGLANHYVLTSMLQIIAKQKQPDLAFAKQLFVSAHTQPKIDAHLYSAYLQVLASYLSQNPKASHLLTQIHEVLAEAKQKQALDSNCFIQAMTALVHLALDNEAYVLWKSCIQEQATHVILAMRYLQVLEKKPLSSTERFIEFYQDCQHLELIDKTLFEQFVRILHQKNGLTEPSIKKMILESPYAQEYVNTFSQEELSLPHCTQVNR